MGEDAPPNQEMWEREFALKERELRERHDTMPAPKVELTSEEENERARATLLTDRVEVRRRLSKTDKLVKRPHGKGIGVEVKHSSLSPQVDPSRLTVDSKGYLDEADEPNPRWQEILDRCVVVARPPFNELWPLYYPQAASSALPTTASRDGQKG